MDYAAFHAEYTKLFKLMMSYSPCQAGSGHYAEQMAKLSDQYPNFAARAEA
jgi:hypothetical protein